jgi:hypothetical protein
MLPLSPDRQLSLTEDSIGSARQPSSNEGAHDDGARVSYPLMKEKDRTMQIKDHVFIVTGASSGIGLATAAALSGRGAKVALLARNTAKLCFQN